MHENSRHITLWVSVAIVGAIILVGWIFSLRYNFALINQTAKENISTTSEQAFSQFQSALDSLGEAVNAGRNEGNATTETEQ